MQPTSSEKPTELVMWWPHPDSFRDLTVIDNEGGWELSAPDDTELSDWIAYWDQSEEHHEFFQKEFLKTLCEHAKLTLETHGQTQDQSDKQSTDRVDPQDDGSRSLSEHEPGSDAQPSS